MPPKKKVATPAPGAAFERLRQRAAGIDLPNIPDFVLGSEDGFDPEIRVKMPLSLSRQESFYYAARNDDMFAQLRVVLGNEQYERIKTALEPEPDSSLLFIGLARMVLDHITGSGAGDVEGGSGQS